MSRPQKNHVNWDDYQIGTSYRSSGNSGGTRNIHFEDGDRETRSSISSAHQDHLAVERQDYDKSGRRRSSVALRFDALTHAGGDNSIASFARSRQRAAGFHEVAPRRPSLQLTFDNDVDEENAIERYQRTDFASARTERTSLLRQHFEALPADEEAAVEEGNLEHDSTTPRPLQPGETDLDRSTSAFDFPRPLQESEANRHCLGSETRSGRRNGSLTTAIPHLVAELAGSHGTSYGTLRSGRRESLMVHAEQIWQQKQQQQDVLPPPDEELEPLIVKEVEQDGKIVLAVAGQSTLSQTIFNATNVLVGVGLLSLPLAIKYSGMVCGMIFLIFASIVTAYTANLLAKCLDLDVGLITFADLAFISYGNKAWVVTSILFTLELLASCVALVVLFADTLNLLIPGISVTGWKVICGFLLIPLNLVPLRLLSFTSVLGIFSCFCIVLIVFVDGFIKAETPGSLREPAKTYLFPENWLTLPISFGILMSSFGGHSVFPSIYRDMRQPHKYTKGVKITFALTFLLDAATAFAGILMFGDGVKDEITANILEATGYPKSLSLLTSIFIAIIPLTKLPLNARPIVSTIEVLSGLDAQVSPTYSNLAGLGSWTQEILKVTVRVSIITIFVIIAIIFPAFDSIMAFMGSALCFTICVILPLLFHLKLFGEDLSRPEKILNYCLIVVCSIFGMTGAVFAFLPKKMIGAERYH